MNDQKLRQRLGHKAHEDVQAYRADIIWGKWENCWNRLGEEKLYIGIMICDSRMISEYILKKIKLYLRQDKVVIVYFCNVCMGNFEWLYRFYVYAYRELNVAELIDDKLIIKNIPYSLELDLVHIKEQAYKEVWGINK